MDGISGADLARELKTSVPRVSRAIARLKIEARQPNGRLALSPAQADRIRRSLGVTPRINGLTRPETRALAALRTAPFGLVSARAVARRSGLSPTAAATALRSLVEKDLVVAREETIAAGRAKRTTIWRANFTHPSWRRLDPRLAEVLPPDQPPEPVKNQVPAHLRHLFWNTAEPQLDVGVGGPYIARRLLRTMDPQGLAWGARSLGAEDWREGARARGLDPGTRQLARNLAQAAESRARVEGS